MKLSIIILCWNDRNVIIDCLESISSSTRSVEFEVIISDNGSTDGSVELIRSRFPWVKIVENGRNARFAKGNNVGIRASRGEYSLILNPDTLIHDGALDSIVSFADRRPDVGAFGCQVLNSDGSYQVSARPFASIRGEWVAAFYLRKLGHLHWWFKSDTYVGWDGSSERTVDWLSGCFILVRTRLLNALGGFDERFFYYYEDMDLCRRIWQAGYSIVYTPEATITHLGGQSTKRRFTPLAFVLDSQTTRYLYYHKYYGKYGVYRARRVVIASLIIRWLGYRLKQVFRPIDARRKHLDVLKQVLHWNIRVDPIRLVEKGEDPTLSMIVPDRVVER